MTSISRIPQHLAPYVENVPQDSLALLSGTLSNTANWLVVRYLCAAFSNDSSRVRKATDNPAPGTEDVGVVLVSWMRDFEFWKTETRRVGGLDLASLSQSKKFAYVDGLASSTQTSAPLVQQVQKPKLLSRPSPSSSSILPERRHPLLAGRGQATPKEQTISSTTPKALYSSNIPTTDLAHVRNAVEAVLTSLSTSSALLVLDAPELLLALQPPLPAAANYSTSTALQSLIVSLRLHPRVHATILSLSSDITPLASARPEQHIQSPLETDNQALLIGLAHQADIVISARGLDTGAAEDVGGILKITKGGGVEDEGCSKKDWQEHELLYLIKTDGSAKVWERGAGVGVG